MWGFFGEDMRRWVPGGGAGNGKRGILAGYPGHPPGKTRNRVPVGLHTLGEPGPGGDNYSGLTVNEQSTPEVFRTSLPAVCLVLTWMVSPAANFSGHDALRLSRSPAEASESKDP